MSKEYLPFSTLSTLTKEKNKMKKILELVIGYTIIMGIAQLTFSFTKIGFSQALIGIGLTLGLIYLLDK